MTRLTTPFAAGQEYVISLIILALAAGIVLGSATTYIFIPEKTQTGKKLKQS